MRLLIEKQQKVKSGLDVIMLRLIKRGDFSLIPTFIEDSIHKRSPSLYQRAPWLA